MESVCAGNIMMISIGNTAKGSLQKLSGTNMRLNIKGVVLVYEPIKYNKIDGEAFPGEWSAHQRCRQIIRGVKKSDCVRGDADNSSCICLSVV